MKNIKKIIICMAFAIAVTSVNALAADIKFTPEGNGKWIFCNNPEGIRNQDLMNHPDYEPTYIMNNEHLTPDLYDFLICHINGTDTDGGYGAGYDIEIDMEITAEEDSVLTINKSFFETPKTEAFIFSDGRWDKEMGKVGCLNSFASFIGVNFCELNGSWLYEAKKYEPVTLEIKKGETVWLGEYTDGYSKVPYGKPAQLLGEIELTEGKISFNAAAFKSSLELGDRSGFDPNAKYGKYAYTRTQKGIADSLPKVNCDLEYTIDNTMQDGDYITNKVTNQYVPDGHATDVWCSHLNPQDDVWSKNIAVENDLLPMYYPDDAKLTYYGKNVRASKRNNIWTWDVYHSDTTHYEGSVTWFDNADDYYPNYELSALRSNQGYAVSLGNYCVTESYNLKVKNITNEDKYFEYVAQTIANLAVYVTDEDGAHSGLLKGERNAEEKNVMASVKIPAHGEREFSVNVILPINYVGGMRNRFQISDTCHIEKTYEDYVKEPRAQKAPVTYGVTAEEIYDKLSDEVKKIVDGNEDNYEVVKTDFGYALRYMDWDGSPYYFTNDWVKLKNIYFLDKDYNVTGHYAPENLAELALSYDGYYYIEDAKFNHFRTKDGVNWEEYKHRLPLPEIKFDNSKPSDWALGEVSRAYGIDVAPYDLRNTLTYDAPMTRQTFCYVLSSMLELADKMPTETDNKIKFSDTESNTINKLATAGIISGYDDGSFRPEGEITREEAAVLLWRTGWYMALGEKDRNVLFELDEDIAENKEHDAVTEEEKYADDADIGDWAEFAVYVMKDWEIMQGMGDGTFAPKTTYTNEQSIATILRLYDLITAV